MSTGQSSTITIKRRRQAASLDAIAAQLEVQSRELRELGRYGWASELGRIAQRIAVVVKASRS